MSFITGFAIYFIIWWLTLFVVLPYGNDSQAEVGDVTDGTDPGAPVNPQFLKKLIWNSMLAGAIFLLYWFVTRIFGFSLDNVPNLFPEHLKFGND